MKKIVITGVTSMIGEAILEEALKNDIDRIYAVVRTGCRKLDRIPEDKRIEIIECDIADYERLPELIGTACDLFYHIAWEGTGAGRNKDILLQSRNISHIVHALRAAKELGCGRFIGAGSQAEYGLCDLDKIGPDSPVNPRQAYGIAKYAAGKLAQLEAEQLGIDCIWVRIFSVYGKYDKESTMIGSTLRKMLKNEKTAFTSGIQRWDYLYSEDAGRAFYLIGEKAPGSRVYCLGRGEARPLYEYINEMRDVVNPALEVDLGALPYTKDTVMNLCADISALQKDVGWIPAVGFKQGIRECVEFLKNERAADTI